MSTQRRVVLTAQGPITISPEAPTRVGDRWWALVEARLIDELTVDEPVVSEARIESAGDVLETATRRGALYPRAADGGVVGVVGIPRRVFPLLDVQAYEAGLLARAVGYLPRRRVAQHGPIAAFPDDFAPLDLGNLALHRPSLQLHGRVQERLPSGVIVDQIGVTVTVTILWRRVPTLIGPWAPVAAELVAIHPPLYLPRSAAATQVREVVLAPVAGTGKLLLRDAAPGSTELRLSDRNNLAAGHVLRINIGDPDREEHIRLLSITGTANPLHPGTAVLEHPLAFEHRIGVDVERVVPAPSVFSHSLFTNPAAGDTDAYPGDESLLLAAGAGFGATTFIEVDDGGPLREFHRLDPYQTSSGPGGFYRLPPLHRVAQLTLRAQLGPRIMDRTLSPAYPAREHRVDFLFV